MRRLAPKETLRTNEIAQNFNPIVLNNGNIVQATSFGGVFELNKHGLKKWSHDVEFGVSGSGSTYNKFLFFGSGDKFLHAYDMSAGSILWSTLLEGAVSSVSKFSNGKIFVLTDNGDFYAVKASDGIVEWKVSHGQQKLLKIYGGPRPIVFGGQVIAAFPDGTVASLDQSSGKAKWKIKLQGAQKHDDVDFLQLTKHGFLIAGVFDEALYRLELASGKILWQAFEKPVSEATVKGKNIYFSGAEGDLISLRVSSGNLNSKRRVFTGLGGKPLFLKDKMVVSDSKGPLRLISERTGDVLASYDLISPSTAAMASNRGESKFFMMSDKGYLYSFGIKED